MSRRAAIAMVAALAVVAAAALARGGRPAPPRPERVVLVVAEARGYVHHSIPAAVAFYRRVERTDPRVRVVVLGHAADLTAARLRGADAVAFASTSGDVTVDLPALLAFVRRGGAFVGTHAAADTLAGRPAYGRMLGARFRSHAPAHSGAVVVEDRRHPATRRLPARFVIRDEFYVFRSSPRRTSHVLLRADARKDMPLAWCRRYGRGRVFYSALGHFSSEWRPGRNTTMVAGGLRWALGLTRGACPRA